VSIELTFCRLTIFQWKDESAGAWVREQQELCAPGSYARVFGQLRVYQNVRSVTVHRVRPVEDMNEITYHMAAVMVSSIGESVSRVPSFSSPMQAAGGVKFEASRAGISSMGGMGAGVSPADRCISVLTKVKFASRSTYVLPVGYFRSSRIAAMLLPACL
jgi:hypothetical protein